jgi:hypothetical protein
VQTRRLYFLPVAEGVGEEIGGRGVVCDVLAALLLRLLAAHVLVAEVALGVCALLVGKNERGVVVERGAAEGAGEEADRREDEARADLDERRRVPFLRGRETGVGWLKERRAIPPFLKSTYAVG